MLLATLVVPAPASAQATPHSLGLDPGLGALSDAFPRGAPPMPVCNAPRDGVAACLAGRQCLCGFERGGSITGRHDGWRWDCGVLRPACDVPPADLPGRNDSPPPALFPQVTLPSDIPQQFQGPYPQSSRQPFPLPYPGR